MALVVSGAARRYMASCVVSVAGVTVIARHDLGRCRAGIMEWSTSSRIQPWKIRIADAQLPTAGGGYPDGNPTEAVLPRQVLDVHRYNLEAA